MRLTLNIFTFLRIVSVHNYILIQIAFGIGFASVTIVKILLSRFEDLIGFIE